MKNIDYSEYTYLSSLSEKTRNYIISEVENGNKNLYHSVMAVLMNKIKAGKLKALEEEIKFYVEKYSISLEIQPMIEELITFCYKKCYEKTHAITTGNKNNTINDDYRYLEPLSKETKDFIITQVNNGGKNLYHSIMAVLMNKFHKETIADLETEKALYMKKYNIEEMHKEIICEIMDLCYERAKRKNEK